MTGSMTTRVVENGKGLEIHWPIGMKIVGGVLTLLIGVGVLGIFDMRITLAVLAESTETHIASRAHHGAVPRTEAMLAHEACKENYDELRERILVLERR